jgi:hypothetical protein
MRLSELLGTEVRDADGERVGRVHDVRLVQDGPVQGAFGAALRVDGLVVGRGGRNGLAVRLGYHRQRVNGPYVLNRLVLAMERGARFVPWSQVDGIDGDVVRLRARGDDLPRLRDHDPEP